ncbi:unnamed protein product, partial [Allacma fusca]
NSSRLLSVLVGILVLVLIHPEMELGLASPPGDGP